MVLCSELGDPGVLATVEQPDLACGPGCVRVDVEAAGINFVDALFVAGTYQIKIPPPFVPGSELAGRVSEVGEGVTDWRPGDRVIANIGLGAYCSSTVVRSSQLIALPSSVSMRVGATCGQPYSTAWFALTRRALCRPGHIVAVFGAGGGVGLAACEVAHALGATVIAIASDTDRLELAAQHGATHLIHSSDQDVRAALRSIAPDGVNLVVDPVGGDLSEIGLRSLSYEGELLIIGFASGQIPSLPANFVLLRNRRVTGVDWGKWAMDHPAEQHQLFAEVLDRIVAGDLCPVEPIAFSLDQASEALTAASTRGVVGRLCLVP